MTATLLQAAARRLARGFIAKGYEPEALHTYTDADGNLSHAKFRLRHPATGEKVIRPMRHDGRGDYELGEPTFDGGKPIYQLPELAKRSSELVVVVEGEMCADALANLGALATTSGGADSADSADWSPLARRDVLIWPDNDEPGRRYAQQVAAKLRALGCVVRVVDCVALNLPAAGDAVDWLRDHPTATRDDVCLLPIFADSGETEGAAASGEARAIVEVKTLAEFTPQPITWIWADRLPAGKVVVLDGDPGLGKSTLTMDIAARVTTGAPMPSGSTNGLGRPRGVLFLSAEDDPADTLRPRADRAGADVTKIGTLVGLRERSADGEELLRLPTVKDVAALREAIRRCDAALVVIDPLMAYLTGDAHRDQDVRQSMAPLAQVAAETGASILIVRHLNKSGGGNAVYRGGGSIGIVAAARLGLLVAKDPDDETGERRILAVTKSNLGPVPPSLAYHLDAVNDVPGIVWEGTTDHNANALLAAPRGDEEKSALDEAKDFLRELLADGPVPSKYGDAQARCAGVRERTLDRARRALGVIARKRGRPGAEKQEWHWMLPEHEERQPSPEERQGKAWRSSDLFGALPSQNRSLALWAGADDDES